MVRDDQLWLWSVMLGMVSYVKDGQLWLGMISSG